MTQAQMDPATALAELEETKSDKVTIVLLSGDMDRAMAAFIIATGAAAMGMQVTMFFTFWGLNAIRKTGVRNSPKDWLRRMFGILNKGGAERLPLSRFHFGGLGTRMMKRVMGNAAGGIPLSAYSAKACSRSFSLSAQVRRRGSDGALGLDSAVSVFTFTRPASSSMR